MCGSAPCHYFGYMCRNSCAGCIHCRPGKKEVAAMAKRTKNEEQDAGGCGLAGKTRDPRLAR